MAVPGKEQRITSAVKACKVTQGQHGLPFRKPCLSGILPHPAVTGPAKLILQLHAANLHGKSARPIFRSPWRRPVVSPHIDMPDPFRRYAYRCYRISDRQPEPMGNQIRGTHLIHELLINGPSSLLTETLRLHKNPLGKGSCPAQKEKQHRQYCPVPHKFFR